MSATSMSEIREWFKEGKKGGATHMIVVCDTYDYEDYPKYVYPGQSVHLVEQETNRKEMQRVMEVYYLKGDMETQLNQNRSFNYDNSTIKAKPAKTVFGVKIRKMVDGKYLYSMGGSTAITYENQWNRTGKVWATEGHAKSHLTMLTHEWGRKKRVIPEDWQVVTMYDDGTSSVRPAKELAERPAKK